MFRVKRVPEVIVAKTALQKLRENKAQKMVVLDKDFAGIKAGQRMLVGTPQMIDEYMRKVPRGEVRSVHRMRNELARRNKCHATCPVSTGIFVRIAAEAAIEQLQAGEPLDQVTPFWRTIQPEDKVADKLSLGSDWIRHQRELEQALMGEQG